MGRKVRRIGGKKYKRSSFTNTKAEAQQQASNIRNTTIGGFGKASVRVVREKVKGQGKGYSIYSRRRRK